MTNEQVAQIPPATRHLLSVGDTCKVAPVCRVEQQESGQERCTPGSETHNLQEIPSLPASPETLVAGLAAQSSQTKQKSTLAVSGQKEFPHSFKAALEAGNNVVRGGSAGSRTCFPVECLLPVRRQSRLLSLSIWGFLSHLGKGSPVLGLACLLPLLSWKPDWGSILGLGDPEHTWGQYLLSPASHPTTSATGSPACPGGLALLLSPGLAHKLREQACVWREDTQTPTFSGRWGGAGFQV